MIFKINFKTVLSFFILITSSFTCSYVYSQSTDDHLITVFEEYAAAPREVAYVHLNKSTYIKGEMIGFKAYVFDKYTKELSEMTTNLYCTISDIDGNVVKKKMLYVKDGISANVFNVDDSLKTGTYVFKAYTNWMRNFNEQNHFQQAFKVIDASNNDKIVTNYNDNLDIQVLGEGGHLIYDVLNSIGIIVKNTSGKGLPNAEGIIIDDLGNTLANFKLNNYGIAKSIFKPEKGRRYFITILNNGKTEKSEINGIKNNGISITINDIKNSIAISLKTNRRTLENIKSNQYKIAIHNGNNLSSIPLKFKTVEEIRVISKKELFSGINIITILTENNKPLLERLYFNNLNQSNTSIDLITNSKVGDSLELTFKIKEYKRGFSSLSASLLPSKTESYTHNQNIWSQIYLEPYVKGYIENGGYYFKDSERKTLYDLDLLLLTQGWSSYDWNSIFNFENNFPYAFEQGIDVVATINKQADGGTYMVYPLKNNSTQLFTLKGENNIFTYKTSFPTNGEDFRVGHINKNRGYRPGVYPQFYPSEIKPLGRLDAYLSPELTKFSDYTDSVIYSNSWSNVEELKEVVIEGKSKAERYEKLKNEAINSQITVVSDQEKRIGTPLDQIITRLGFFARYDPVNAIFTIINPRVNWGDNKPLVYVDDALIQDFNFLRNLNTSNIDYIESEKYGFGGGIRGNAGFIKIYTSYDFLDQGGESKNNISSYPYPLVFESDKKFYTPIYQFYDTPFYHKFGVIDWFPNIIPNEEGEFKIKILNTNSPINIYLEGIFNENRLLSTAKPLELN